MIDLHAASYAVNPIAGLPAVPAAQIDPFKYQIAAVQQTLHARKHGYCAHHPGAGKTPMALLASLAYPIDEPVVVVCPPSICYQWARQAYRWTGLGWLVASTSADVREFAPNLRKHLPARLIVPDSLLHVAEECLGRVALLIADEAHRLKTRDARRTRAFFGYGLEKGLVSRAEKVMALSGTPMQNTPVDLYPFLHACFPNEFPNFANYTARFCPPEKEWVWRGARKVEITTYKTAINKDMLGKLMRNTGFIRPRREDVQAQLPPLRTDFLQLDTDHRGMSMLDALDAIRGDDPAKKLALASERRELGMLKAEAAIPYLETVIEGGDAPVIWTWHASAADMLGAKLQCPVIHGGKTPEQRRDAIDLFTSGRAPAIVCTIGAAGTGVDGLQARTDLAIFIERPYNATEMEQTIGRLWRTGQRNPVRIVIVTTSTGIDHAIAEILDRKAADARDILA